MRRVDVVVLTAIALEYGAALQVEAGASKDSRWEEENGPNGLPVAFRTFLGKGGRPLRVAVALAGDMGAVAATNALLPLVEALGPRCVAMSGVCAGRPGKTNLGDVIAAERLFFHDTGKRLPETVQQDLRVYSLRDDWKVALERFEFAGRFRDEAWWKARPVPYAWQENWVLAMLRDGVEDPSSHPECDTHCPQWDKVITSLWKAGHVRHGTLTLTEEGRARIEPILIQHRKQLPNLSPAGTLLPFKIHVAPMGSGNQVIEDEAVWSFVSEHMRKTLGLEMEAAALGALAHAQRDRRLDALVMKGVMDFANHGRDDHFKEFAARASAECLLAFLREHFDVEVVPDLDDLLVSGTSPELPENPPPSALLQARYEVVPFRKEGRESALVELERWCDGGPATAARLLHAEGGVGKTRFAIELIRRCREEKKWAAGFLPKEVPSDWFNRLWELGPPVLVVVDYAESRADLRETLLRVLRYAEQRGAGMLRRTRVLLLARNDGDWWQSLRQADAALGAWLDATPPYELPPLAMNEADRAQVFREAAEKFAEQRNKPYVKHAPVPLTDACFERVLYLHMAALAAVEGLPFEANTLMDVILDHEERFWELRARQADVTRSLQRSLARQMTAVATLRGGLADASSASSLAERLLGRGLFAEEVALLHLLQRIYQRTGPDSALFLPALEPDLLGEGMVLRVAAPRLQGDRPAPDWIERVFPPEDDVRAVSTGLEVLGRASATQPSVVRPWLDRLLAGPLRPRARCALEAAKAVGLRTAFSALGEALADRLEVDGTVELALELKAAGLPDPTVSLGRVAEWVVRTLLRAVQSSQDAQDLASRARLLHDLGGVLSDAGRREEALEATREAVRLFRALAQRDPEAFQRELASSLQNQGSQLSKLGRREAAFEVTLEALVLYRAVAQRAPDTVRPQIAGGLHNLGVMLHGLGQREAALEATREATELRRVLVQRSPEVFRPDFASSLNNLGLMLRELGRPEEALDAARQAVEQRRVLAQRAPDAYQPDLAASLNNLAIALGDLGHRKEALEVARQAAEVYRLLAQRFPDAFQPDFASSLMTLGSMLSKLAFHEEALKATQEAVELHRALVRRSADRFRPDLAGSLTNLGNRLGQLGRREEALEAVREAVALYRALAQPNPDAFQPALATSLYSLANRLNSLERHEDALEAVSESVRLFRALAQHNPEAFQPGLANALQALAFTLILLNQQDEALEVLPQAIQLYRALARDNPDAFQPELARVLFYLGCSLRVQERHERALEAMQEGVDRLWPYFERLQPIHQQNTRSLLTALAELHETLQRPLPPLLLERITTFLRRTSA